MKNIDLELYKIFKIVADNNNITRASEILYISQPAITKQINSLEKQLNKKLFDRTTTGTFLNEDGKKLYNEISDSVDKLLNASEIFDYESKLDLGVHVNMPKNQYNDYIYNFYKNNDNSIINIHLLTAETLFEKLKNKKIDLVFSKEYDESIYDSSVIKFIKLGEFSDAFIVNSNSKYIGISPEKLKKENIYTLKKFSKTYNNLVNILNYTEKELDNIKNINYSGIIDLLDSRDVVAYLTKEYVSEYLNDNKYMVLDIGPDKKESYGIYYNINNKNEMIDKLIECFQNK